MRSYKPVTRGAGLAAMVIDHVWRHVRSYLLLVVLLYAWYAVHHFMGVFDTISFRLMQFTQWFHDSMQATGTPAKST